MTQSPFPGMDPYLESPALWPDVHNSLIYIFREQLAPKLAPKYVTELEAQIVIDRFEDNPPRIEHVVPDVTITQPNDAESNVAVATRIAPPPLRMRVPVPISMRLLSLYIRQRENEQLVAVIEVLALVNKRPGEGRQEYIGKRFTFLSQPLHLIEIDLLRKWPRMPLEGRLPASAYLATICDAYERPICSVWPIGLRQSLPVLPIPLLRPDPPVDLDLGQALRTAYERAHYNLRIDYRSPPDPPLEPADTDWAAGLIAARGQ